MSGSLAERYVRLGLQVGRHVDGIVDAYFGPPEWAAEVDAAPPVEPRTLVAEAGALLGEVEDGWLRDQLAGLRVYAGVLAGESASYPDEVEGCYGVRPTFTDESVFEAAHDGARGAAPRRRPARRAVRGLADIHPRAGRAGRAHGGGGDRGGPPLDAPAGRPARGRGHLPRAGQRRAVARVQRLPRRPPEPDRGQRRPAACGNRAAPPRDPRDVRRPPHRALRRRSTRSCAGED